MDNTWDVEEIRWEEESQRQPAKCKVFLHAASGAEKATAKEDLNIVYKIIKQLIGQSSTPSQSKIMKKWELQLWRMKWRIDSLQAEFITYGRYQLLTAFFATI